MLRVHGRYSDGFGVSAVVAALCSLAFLVACGPGASGPVRITGVVPEPGERFDGTLTVVFDGPIRPAVPADGPTTAALVFDPPIAGRVEFGRNHLTLRTADTLSTSVFVTRLTPYVVGADGQALTSPSVLTVTRFEFEPTGLGVVDYEREPPVLGIGFTWPVRPEDLGSRLTLTDATGRDVGFTLENGTNPRLLRVRLTSPAQLPVEAAIAAGLPETGGRFRMRRPHRVTMPEARRFRVAACEWGSTGREAQEIRLHFSEPPDLAAVERGLIVEDIATTQTRPLAFRATRVQYNRNVVLIRLSAPDPADIKLRLSLPSDLKSVDGNVMAQGWSDEMAVRAELQATSQQWTTRPDGLWLYIQFNHPLDLKDVRPRLTVDPPIGELKCVQEHGKGYRVGGRWSLDASYRVSLAPGVPFGGWLTTQKPVAFIAQTPVRVNGMLGFVAKDRYILPRRFGNVLPVQTIGYEGLRVVLHRVFPSNLALAVDEIQYGLWSAGLVGSKLVSRWSSRVAQADLPLDIDPLESLTTPLHLDRLTSEPLRGIYALTAQGMAGGDAVGRPDTRLLLMTDLGMLAHWQRDELLVFVHDLHSLRPTADGRVAVYSVKNQLLGGGRTNAEGTARLSGFDPDLGEPYVVVVEAEDDFTFLPLNGPEREALPRGAEGAAYDADEYDAFIHADRDLYRPGDTVHLRWLVRQRYGDALAGAPLTLEVLKPNRKPLLTRTIELSEWGVAGFDLPTQRIHPTGRYRVRLKIPGGEKIIGHYDFRLEEFVPHRMKAELSLDDARWVDGRGPFEIALNAQHLFGAPAAGRIAEARLTFSGGFSFPHLTGFRFDNDRAIATDDVPLGEVETDAAGRAVFRHHGRAGRNDTKPLRVRVRGEVRELGGREVGAAPVSAVWFPSPVCLGLNLEPSTSSQSVAVHVAAVQPDGGPAETSTATVTLERATWSYSVRRYSTHRDASLTGGYAPFDSREAALVDGRGRVDFTVEDYGRYRVTVGAPGNPQVSTMEFSVYGGRPHVSASPEPELVTLELEPEDPAAGFAVGRMARLTIRYPFDGARAVVVVQGERLHRVLTTELRDRMATVDLEIQPDWYPNVWIETTVIHPLADEREEVFPFSSFAATMLRVVDPDRAIDVAFDDPPVEVRPAEPHEIVIRTRDAQGRPVAAAVTLAAVDEGIHGITNYRTPDPLGWFGRPRRPEFHYAHYYDRLADKWKQPAPGGDDGGGGGGEQRLGRPGTNWIRTVALWSGEVVTDADGRAAVMLDLPEFDGRLRLVAVAANARATGVAEAPLLVRRPWLLQTSLPRFLLPGDRARTIGTLYNLSPTTGTTVMTAATSGTLALADATRATRALRVSPGDETTMAVELLAGESPGRGVALWSAEVADADGRTVESLRQTAALPVGEPAAYEARPATRVLQPGESARFDSAAFRQDDWTGLSITVGANPLLRLENALKSVVGYPYGCVEQTVSRLLPLYLLRKQSALLDRSVVPVENLDLFLQAGIDRLFAMQTASGGLANWPGSNIPYPYGSIYALHFLTLAHNGRELSIDEMDYAVLRRYVRRLALDPADGTPAGLYQRAYAVYVLALGGDREAVEAIARFETLEMPRASRYLLAAALARNTRDEDRVRVFLNAAATFEYNERTAAGILNSPIRNRAVQLLALVEMKAPAEELQPLADELARFLEGTSRATTQESAFVIAALASYLDHLAADTAAAAATIRRGETESAIEGLETFRERLSGPGGAFVVANTGRAPIYVNTVASGIPLAPPDGPVADGVVMGRRFLRQDGSTVEPDALLQGESYIVQLSIGPERDLENFVVADLLPAGLEVQNPRLDRETRADSAESNVQASPSHLELRDDRVILVFDRLVQTRYNDPDRPDRTLMFRYVVDAVTPGIFQHPPAVGECMYDPATRGATAGGSVTIHAR
jgi:uncharacterized protein YfaS (alpha-2-macroglobulin family)